MKSLQQIVEGILDADFGEDDNALISSIMSDVLDMEDDKLDVSVQGDTVTVDIPSSKKYLDIFSLDKLTKLGVKNIEFTNSKNCKLMCRDCNLKDINIKCDGIIHFYSTESDHRFINVNIQCEHLVHGANWTALAIIYKKCTVDCKTMTVLRTSEFFVSDNSKMNIDQLYLLRCDESFNKCGKGLGVECFGTGDKPLWKKLLRTSKVTFSEDIDVLNVLDLKKQSWPQLKKVVISTYEDDGYGIAIYKKAGNNALPLSMCSNYKIEYKNNWMLQLLYNTDDEKKYCVSEKI